MSVELGQASRGSASLTRWFWLAVVGLVLSVAAAFNADEFARQLTGCVLGAVALIPTYLWCAGKVNGLPIFPSFALTYLATYASPLVFGHAMLARYTLDVVIGAGLTTILFLALATLIWYWVLRASNFSRPHEIRVLNPRGGSLILLFVLVCVIGFNMSMGAGWLALEWTILSFLRAASLALETLAVVALSYQLGSRTLSASVKLMFIALLIAHMIVQTIGLYLSAAFMTTLVGVTAYTAARRRLPLVWLVSVLAVVILLNPGKSEMRAWKWQQNVAVAPWDYPAFYARWIEASAGAVRRSGEGATVSESSTDRASIIHMLMLVQKQSPEPRPFLEGESYAHIPYLIVPRFLDPDKPTALEGQSVMCVYYGLQTREQTRTTRIAFGLPAEAYANFGYLGIAGLAVIIGLTHGLVTCYCGQYPVLSLRTLFGFVFLGVFINGERCTAVVVSSLFQATVVLVIAMYPLLIPMRIGATFARGNGSAAASSKEGVA